MTIVLTLPEELEQRLKEAAERLGLSVDEYTLRLLEKHIPQDEKRSEAIGLIQSWIDDQDAKEQIETGEYLIKVLDEDRLSERKLFPPELKGVSW
jgi:predicted DNA-binding protein